MQLIHQEVRVFDGRLLKKLKNLKINHGNYMLEHGVK